MASSAPTGTHPVRREGWPMRPAAVPRESAEMCSFPCSYLLPCGIEQTFVVGLAHFQARVIGELLPDRVPHVEDGVVGLGSSGRNGVAAEKKAVRISIEDGDDSSDRLWR